MRNKNIILGIETSCDEIGISVFNNEKGFISEYTYSQIIHEKYGGTIPELSSRENIKKITNIIIFTIKKAKIKINEIKIISYTKGPGLKSPLMIGGSIAKSLSYSLKIPCIGINHLEAHITISLLFNKNIKFPCLALITSGAHTMILHLKNHNTFFLLEESQDDGIGEVFDKVARAIKLKPYNGSSIEKTANNKKIYTLTKLSKKANYKKTQKLSFSGIKTTTINFIKNSLNYNKSETCYNFQINMIKITTLKCKNIIEKYNITNLILAGGVASNKEFRLNLKEYINSINGNFYYIPKKYCTDNGGMIAFLGFIKTYEGFKDKILNINIFPELKINQ
ncbi:MAG TPA: tRNA (adenosine(37)-N6)-threonylcarbamoyltransferase complex transferase subunit TsaD [Candidatus Azoamicus sp.]